MASPENPTSADQAQVILLSGFLGAGKTTLLKEILSWQTDLSDTVVIVNEFGEVGIDGALLQDAATDVVELTSGCICCTLKTGLMLCLRDLWNRFHPRRIFIESSGVADPAAIREILDQEQLRDIMVLEKIVTVLDADFWEDREAFGRLFYNQLEMAHLILLNKIDLLEEDKIPQYLQELHELIPNGQVVPTQHCRIDPETLWVKPEPKVFGIMPMRFYQRRSQADTASTGEGGAVAAGNGVSAGEAGFKAFSFESERPFNADCFEQFLAQLPFTPFSHQGTGALRGQNRAAELRRWTGRLQGLGRRSRLSPGVHRLGRRGGRNSSAPAKLPRWGVTGRKGEVPASVNPPREASSANAAPPYNHPTRDATSPARSLVVGPFLLAPKSQITRGRPGPGEPSSRARIPRPCCTRSREGSQPRLMRTALGCSRPPAVKTLPSVTRTP